MSKRDAPLKVPVVEVSAAPPAEVDEELPLVAAELEDEPLVVVADADEDPELVPDLEEKSAGSTGKYRHGTHVEALLAVEEPDDEEDAGGAAMENSPLCA